MNCYDQEQSIADHVYGTMILAVAFYSEYGRKNHLGNILRKILLAEMKNASLESFDSCLENFSKGKGYLLEVKEVVEFYLFSSFGEEFSDREFIQFCKSLDKSLYTFFEVFLKQNSIGDENCELLFQLAKETGYFISYGLNERDFEIFRFYFLNYKLKNKIRSGWDSTHWNVSSDRIERISEHIVGTMALALAIDSGFELEIDIDKILSTLCIHEVGEILIGDITPFDGTTPEEKQKIEHRAIIEVIGNLTKNRDMIDLIFEFDDKKTENAKFAHYCDKLEADIQAKVYQDMGCHHPLTEQRNNVVFKSSKVQKMVADGAETAFDIWYEWDKSIYTNSPIFMKTLKYVKNTKLR